MAKGRVKTSVAIDFNVSNVCDRMDSNRAKQATTATASTSSFSFSKDENAATHPDKEMFRVVPYVEGTVFSTLFGTLEEKGPRTEAFSEMLQFNGGHEASPSKPLYGGVNIAPLGQYRFIPKWVTPGATTANGAPANPPDSSSCNAAVDGVFSATVGFWDNGPPVFWYNETENKVYCSHDVWQTVLIDGVTAYNSVEYTYPAKRLIRGPSGYPFRNDVLRAEATELVYYRNPGNGTWSASTRLRTGTTTTGLLFIGNRVEVYRVVSSYIADSTDKWEMPEGWPVDSAFPNGTKGPKPAKSATMTRIHELGYILLDGTFKADEFYHPACKPYDKTPGYLPKFVYVEANMSGEILDVRDSLIDMVALKKRLATKFVGIDMLGGR